MMRAILVAAAVAATPSLAAPPSPTGSWRTADGAAIVAVQPCGEALCGRIARILRTSAPDGIARDVNNKDAALRGRPLLGVTILSGLRRSGDGWADGTIYDPVGGASYTARLAMDGPDRMTVSGCVFLFCRSQSWSRAETGK